jgi:hypothetical protein
LNATNIEMLERAAGLLARLPDAVVYLGGATIELWATDEAAPNFRPTKDVDVVVEVTTLSAYYRFEDRLRAIGFSNDEEDGVICRFRHCEPELVLDAMPPDTSILGFENRWQKLALPHAVDRTLPSGRAIAVISPPYLLATKLEAFRSRGEGDLYRSRDFEDIVLLVDSRAELGGEVSSSDSELRDFVAEELGALCRNPSFDSAGEGMLKGGPETQARWEQVVRRRIEAMLVNPPPATL